MNNYKFSIGIPAYKSIYLSECVESILAQEYSNFELIIVNDCSPNPVAEVLSTFSDSRIRYFKNEANVGAEKVVNNWNICLGHATGDFFILMGDDDKMEKGYLAEFADLINRYPALDVYHCRTVIIDDKGEPIALTPSWPEYENVYDNIWHRITERRSQYISDFVYRVNPLKLLGGFFYLPLAWGSDDITAYRAAIGKGIANTNKPVFNYRRNSYSITSTGNWMQKMQANVLYGEWMRDFLIDAPKQREELIVYNDLVRNAKKNIQVRKIYVMTRSMESKPIGKVWMWYKNRHKFDLSAKEIAFSFINSFKRKFAKSSY